MKKNLILLLSLILSVSLKAQIVFDAQDTLSTHQYNAQKVLAADIDGDGIKDIIAGSNGISGEIGKWGTIVWYKNDGNVNFQTADTIADCRCSDLAVGDLNNDGSNDFVYLDSNPYAKIIWYSNGGTGNFTKRDTIKQYFNSAGIVSIAICDMDKDGDKDVVSSYYNADTIAWFENNTIGSGAAWIEHVITDNYDGSDIVPVDIDADGDIDLITVSPGNWLVTWFENNGSGAWTNDTIARLTTNQPYSVFVSDLDNDGDLDILTGSRESPDSARVSWYANLGSGNFGSENEIYAIQKGGAPNYKQFNDILTADLDLDGDEDIIAASDDNKIVSIENLGNGVFSTAHEITTQVDNPVSIFTADLDGTTDIDLLSASRGDNKIAYYNNITPIILQDPQDADSVCVGTDSVLFVVKALNVGYYAWKENDLNSSTLSDNARYHGTTTDSLYVDADYDIMNGYKYICVIHGINGSSQDTSEFATLTVDKKIIADAGNDKSFCEASSMQLNGNNPLPHIGTWTSSVGTASFNNSTVFNTTTQNFGTGSIEMYWSIDNKSCGISKDTMIIKNYQNIIASAGTDDEICDTTKYQLQGSTYSSPSWAKWYVNRTEVTFDDDSSPTAIASNIPAGNTTFTWYISNGSCGSTSDDMIISRYETIIADAGNDVVICNQTVTSIQANNPSPASGYWTASNATVIIADSNYHATNLSNIPHGSTTFTWTIVNHACGSNSDEMILSSYNYVNIDEQPADLTLEEGEKANLKLKVSGDVASYQWYKNDNILNNDSRITGTTTDSLIINNSVQTDIGSYKCVFIDYCYQNENTSNVAYLTVNATSTGIKDIDKAGISIYPNPSNGQFQIANTGNSINKISVINMQGKIIYELNKLENNPVFINLTSYPKGIYMLNIYKNKQSLKYGIIIQ